MWFAYKFGVSTLSMNGIETTEMQSGNPIKRSLSDMNLDHQQEKRGEEKLLKCHLLTR